ncbi:MAG: transglutaminase family protein [Planctomycetia bacterium]|nr:transglutaminase family protein [Planctomycetia bacterium]
MCELSAKYPDNLSAERAQKYSVIKKNKNDSNYLPHQNFVLEEEVYTRPTYKPSKNNAVKNINSPVVSDTLSVFPDPSYVLTKDSPLARGEEKWNSENRQKSYVSDEKSPSEARPRRGLRALFSAPAEIPSDDRKKTRAPLTYTMRQAPPTIKNHTGHMGYTLPEQEPEWLRNSSTEVPGLDKKFLRENGTTKALDDPTIISEGFPEDVLPSLPEEILSEISSDVPEKMPERPLNNPSKSKDIPKDILPVLPEAPYLSDENDLSFIKPRTSGEVFDYAPPVMQVAVLKGRVGRLAVSSENSSERSANYVSPIILPQTEKIPSRSILVTEQENLEGSVSSNFSDNISSEISLIKPVRFLKADAQLYELKLSPAQWFTKYIGRIPYHEHQLIQEYIRNELSNFSLLEASVIASHAENTDVANQILRKYEQVQRQLSKRILPGDSQLSRAEKILTFMHEELLYGGYQLEQTTMENLFMNGRYNCVTATILYCSLARTVGLEAQAVELPGHAMCWVKTERGKIDVETTCRTWFQYLDDPQTRKQVIQELIRQAQGDLHTARIRPITDRELIAKVYYNRGVDFLTERNFARALEANALALLLDPESETTKGNLLATMNNWAIYLCQNGKYAQAAELLRHGMHVEPDYVTFRNNHVHVYHRWIEALFQAGRFQDSLQVTDLAMKEQPQEPHFKNLREKIRNRITATAALPVSVY